MPAHQVEADLTLLKWMVGFNLGCRSATLINQLVGSRSASEARINELGEGRSLYMTMLLGAR